MFRSAVSRWWDTHKIYHTQVFQELWVGIILTGYVYYKISYGGKKSVEDSKKFWVADIVTKERASKIGPRPHCCMVS